MATATHKTGVIGLGIMGRRMIINMVNHDRFTNPFAWDTGTRLEVSLATGQLSAMGDPIQLEQVILNLGRNAIQAMAGAPSQNDQVLRIWTYAEGESIGIGIQDNGPGFDVAELEENYEPFTSSKLDGLGLGLTISKAIVSQHDGELRVESEPGSGATFTILLPREPNA